MNEALNLVNTIKSKDKVYFQMELPSLEEQEKIVEILEKVEVLKKKRKKGDDVRNKILREIFVKFFGDKEFPIRKLGNLCSKRSSDSTHLGERKNYLKDGDIMFIRSQNILMNKSSNQDKLYITKETHEKMKRTWIKKNDILLNITGAYIGRKAIYLGENDMANVNQHVCIIRIKDHNVINPFYLNYLISEQKIQIHINKINAEGTRQALNYSQIKKFKIPLPPIELQNTFAELVNQFENIKEKQSKSKEKINQVFDALMYKAFNEGLA